MRVKRVNFDFDLDFDLDVNFDFDFDSLSPTNADFFPEHELHGFHESGYCITAVLFKQLTLTLTR